MLDLSTIWNIPPKFPELSPSDVEFATSLDDLAIVVRYYERALTTVDPLFVSMKAEQFAALMLDWGHPNDMLGMDLWRRNLDK